MKHHADKTLACEILVIGSGVSAYCAAIAAGRAGRRVILVEKDEVLGGNSGPNLGVHITGADRYHNYGSETGIVAELQEEAARVQAYTIVPTSVNYNISRRWEAVVQSALEEAGVTVLKRHYSRLPVVRRRRIEAITVEDMATFQTVRIDVSGVVIDGSGDGEMAARAGASYRYGAEGKDETGERSAGKATSWVQGSSLVVILHNTRRPVRFVPPPGTPPFVPRIAQSNLEHARSHHDGSFTPERDLIFRYMTEAGGKMDTIRDDGAIYEMLLKQVWAEWDHIKNGPHAEDARDWDLVWVSPKAGKRESRRFMGDYVLTQTDLDEGRDFPDAVAYGGFDIDRHWHYGEYADIVSFGIPPMYSIPLRSLYSKDLRNLFLAGRMISATHLAHASARVMRTGAAIGQAIGAAAAVCVEKGVAPAGLAKRDIRRLRQALLRDDATILHLRNEDELDLARTARESASSEARFNDQTPGEPAALNQYRGQFVYARPAHLRRAALHMVSTRADDVEVELAVSLTAHERRWRSHEEYEEFGWRDTRPESFREVARSRAVVKGRAAQWVEFEFDLGLPEKDPTSDDDRLLFSLAPMEGVGWSLVSPLCEAVSRTERREGGRWQEVEGRHALRLEDEPTYGEASNIINGFSRRFSSWPTNMWISRPCESLPQWAALEFAAEAEFDAVQVTFDTLHDRYEDMPWNSWSVASGMCAKDYAVEVRERGAWRRVCEVRGNHHRQRRHRIARVRADGVRIVVEAVHDEEKYTARIYEVRVYDSASQRQTV